MGGFVYAPLTPIVGRSDGIGIAAAIEDLVRARVVGEKTELVMPVLYPNGSHVVISVWPNGDRFLVSDDGGAATEADMAGVRPSVFARLAKAEAERVGAVCDTRAFFFLRVDHERLAMAITVLADAARATVAAALETLVAAKRDTLEERLFERLDRTFRGAKVHHHAEVRGASSVEHDVDALVEFDGRRVVFNTFSRNPQSVNALVAKFVDLSQLETPLVRVGVTSDKSRIGYRLQLVSSVGRVIEVDAAAGTYERAAA
ncbi:MAG: hypothetical protein R6V44_17750 [Paracoccaceae bacterium]